MPHYRPSFDEDGLDRLIAAIREVGQDGPFDANDALSYVVGAGITNNAGDVATILTDMSDLGYLRELGEDPPRWELV